MVLRQAYSRLRITQMADFDFFGKLLMLAVSKFNTTYLSTGFTFLPVITSPAASGRQKIT